LKIRQDPSTKPYYRCLSCAKFRKACGGIPTRDLDLQNWCEYMRDVKEVSHLTNAYISKEADVSIKTIERIMAINCDQDIRRSTARRIELVIIGPVGKHFCDIDYDGSAATDRITSLLAEIERLQKENARYAKIIDKYLE
jgi:hypothetical protein